MSTWELILIPLGAGFQDFRGRGGVSLLKFLVHFNGFLELEILCSLK